MQEINSVNEIQDITVLLLGFAEDGLSDLITNILHQELSEFTDMQMKKYGKESNGEIVIKYRDDIELIQKTKLKSGYLIFGKEFLLVPKDIVRKKQLFNAGQYFSRVILDRMREEYTDANGGAISDEELDGNIYGDINAVST